MKTTDEMILDLVEAGFVLPEGLLCETYDGFSWFLQNHNGRAFWHLEGGQHKHAHDLCAMEFARQIRVKDDAGKLTRSDPSDSTIANMRDVLGVGDSAAAIKALWKGVCGCTTKKNA